MISIQGHLFGTVEELEFSYFLYLQNTRKTEAHMSKLWQIVHLVRGTQNTFEESS